MIVSMNVNLEQSSMYGWFVRTLIWHLELRSLYNLHNSQLWESLHSCGCALLQDGELHWYICILAAGLNISNGQVSMMIHPMNTTQACGRPRCLHWIKPSRIMHHLNLNFSDWWTLFRGVFGTFSIFALDRHAEKNIQPLRLRYCHIPPILTGDTRGELAKMYERDQKANLHFMNGCTCFWCVMSSKILRRFFWIYDNLWVLVSNMSMAMALIRQPGNSSSLITWYAVLLMLSPRCRDQIGALQRPPLPHGIGAPWLTVARFQIFRMIVQSDCWVFDLGSLRSRGICTFKHYLDRYPSPKGRLFHILRVHFAAAPFSGCRWTGTLWMFGHIPSVALLECLGTPLAEMLSRKSRTPPITLHRGCLAREG